jgi:hypothetical protein
MVSNQLELDQLESQFKTELSKLGAALHKNPAVPFMELNLVNQLQKKFIEYCDGVRLLAQIPQIQKDQIND